MSEKASRRPDDLLSNSRTGSVPGEYVVNFFKKDRTTIPPLLEAILSWILAVIFVTYYGILYLLATQAWPLSSRKRLSIHSIPITSSSRNNVYQGATAEDYLVSLLRKLKKMIAQEGGDLKDFSCDDDEVIRCIRSDPESRQLASLAISNKQLENDKHNRLPAELENLKRQLYRIWHELLVIPSDNKDYPYEISLIIPAYRERGIDILSGLLRALSYARDPQRTQVVLVDAGLNTDIQMVVETFKSKNENEETLSFWGDIKLVEFPAGGGRGPCLNFGAQHADGKVLTFLHADTILPREWDQVLRSNLIIDNKEVASNCLACAFAFQINTSREALRGASFPAGISAAQWLGKMRTEVFHVLYGDSVLSIRSSVFHYIGGYPNQPLMEDYELMDLLRKRAAVLPETIVIDSSPALNSARRWQKHGVLYVTLLNFQCVYLYVRREWSPEKLYQHYYQRSVKSSVRKA